MKKILFILAILLAGLTANATDYYVAPPPLGNNGNAGTSPATPWATLYYATSTVAAGAHTIHVAAGTYTENTQCILAVGVSIVGAGVTTVISTTGALDPVINAVSTPEGTDGDQSISYIKFDGTSVALSGIYVARRDNFIIHHCYFEDYLASAVIYRGATNSTGGPTTTYGTGNKFHNNTVYNCARYSGGTGSGALAIGGQSGMLVYNNAIEVVDRAGAGNGYGIKYNSDGWNKGLKIYDNTITVPTFDNTGYCFAIELWSQRGGIEIYNNTLKGAIDFGGYDTNDDGGYGYAAKVYNNTIGWDAAQTYSTSGIYLELGVHDGMYIYNNEFKNLQYGIRFNVTSNDLVPGMEDIYIYYNVFNNLRTATSGYTGQVTAFATVADLGSPSGYYNVTFDNIQFLNNVIYNPTSGTLAAGFFSSVSGHTFTDIQVRNNIFVNAFSTVKFENATVTRIDVTNNIFHTCNNTTVYEICTVTDSTYTNNLTSDPDFIVAGSNFRLNDGSPARDAGIDVSLASDYDGNIVPQGTYPDIGAFEYIVLPVGTTGLGWEDVLSKRNFKDDVNLKQSRWMIGGIPVTATASELNALVGQGQIISGIDTASLSNRIDSKADTSLSNLASVAINTHLLPGTDEVVDLGSGAKRYGDIFMTGSITTPSSISTGSLTTNVLKVGVNGATIDTIKSTGTAFQVFDNGVQLSPDIPPSGYAALSDYVPLLGDTLTGAGQYTSDHRADLIEADLADYEIGIAASDTAAMLAKYGRKLSPTFTGTPAAPTAAVGTTTTQLATTAFVFANTNTDLLAYAAMGSVIKALPVGLSLVTGTNSTQTLSDGRTHYVAVYLSIPQTITGIKLYQATAGDYTADNYNGVGLYSVSGGTLTLRASSSDDGNIWKATANTIITKAFATPYAAPAGLYYIAILYNQSAQTTAPVIRGAASNTNVLAFDFANTLFISGTISSQNALATPTIESSTISAYSVVPFGALY